MIKIVSGNTVATLKTSYGKKNSRGYFGEGTKQCRFSFEGIEVESQWDNAQIGIDIHSDNEYFIETFSLDFKLKTAKPASEITIWSEIFGEISSSDTRDVIPLIETQKQKRTGSWAMWLGDSPGARGLFLGQVPPADHFVSFQCHPINKTLRLTWIVNCIIPQNEKITLASVSYWHGERKYIEKIWRDRWIVHNAASTLNRKKGWIDDNEKTSAKDIYANAKKIKDANLPLDWLAVSPVYAKTTGDWLEASPALREHPERVFRNISGLHITPGIRLAPFLVSKTSNIANERADWLVTNDRKTPIKLSGYLKSNETSFVLDITNPAARNHILQLLGKMKSQWGITVFVMDRLYDAVSPGRRYDNCIPCGQLMGNAIKLLREGIGKSSFLLGRDMPLLGTHGMCNIQTQSSTPLKKTDSRFLSKVTQLLLYRTVWNGNRRFNACEPLPVDFIANPVSESQKTLLQVNSIMAGAVLLTGNLMSIEQSSIDSIRAFLQRFDENQYDTVQVAFLSNKEEPVVIKGSSGWLAVFNFTPKKRAFRYRCENLKDGYKIPNGLTTENGTILNSPDIDISLPPWGHRFFKLV